jgi:hypothetical protein
MLGRTHQPCRELHSNKIVLEEMSFEMGKQNKDFLVQKTQDVSVTVVVK